ncbi:MAG: glutamine synthetase [Armatimonadetes bacterium]|nr:glutamine synthetase [Armatimonadota bacterium]MDE2206402.1 glutamine synthetase [Armatimonadota bacterium]
MRGKYLSAAKYLSALEGGLGFCDVIFGWDCADALYGTGGYTGWHTGFPDLLAKIDPATFRYIPWEQHTAMALVDYYRRDGTELPFCPRGLLKRITAAAAQMGYLPRTAVEYEFFLFDESAGSLHAKQYVDPRPESPGMFCYSLARATSRPEFVDALFAALEGVRIELEGFHTETGPGAFEASLRYDDAVTAADSAGLFKATVKEIARQHGLTASFMAKWNADLPGCGGHVHQSLLEPTNRENVFAAHDRAFGASFLALNYLAGQQQFLPEFMAMLAPTINSYKRLVPGAWAPVAATWGVENRTNALRLIPGLTSAATRIETRIPGADASPHLALAACLAAGLHGIKETLEPTAPTSGNAYEEQNVPTLPLSLHEATQRLRNSQVARSWFGDPFVDHFCMTRDAEWRAAGGAVTDWELRRYFEVI